MNFRKYLFHENNMLFCEMAEFIGHYINIWAQVAIIRTVTICHTTRIFRSNLNIIFRGDLYWAPARGVRHPLTRPIRRPIRYAI